MACADTPETNPTVAPLRVLIGNGGAALGVLDRCEYSRMSKDDLSGVQGCFQQMRATANQSTCAQGNSPTYSGIALTAMTWDRFTFTGTQHSWSSSLQQCYPTTFSITWGADLLDSWCQVNYEKRTYDYNGNGSLGPGDDTRCESLFNNPTNGCDPSQLCCPDKANPPPVIPPVQTSQEPKVAPRDTRRSGNGTGVGDPVDLRNGNVFTTEVDVEFPGSALRFARYYNSGDRIYNTLTGVPTLAYQLGNWRGENMATQAIVLSSSVAGGVTTRTAVVTRPDGRSLQYTTTGATPAPGAWATTEKAWQLSGTYDAAGTGRVTKITDQFGNYLQFTYHSTSGLTNKLAALYVNTPTTGIPRATYAYETTVGTTRYFLKQVTYANGTTRSYHYADADFPRGLSRVVNENGDEEVRWDYAASGRGLGSAVGGGTMSPSLDYSPSGQGAPTTTTMNTPEGTVSLLGTWTWVGTKLIQTLGYTPSQPATQTDISLTEAFPNGLVNTFETTPVNGEYRVTRKLRTLGGVTREYLTAYDAAGNITRTTDWNGNVTTYAYNARHLETSRTEGAESPVARTITTEWHATLKLPTKITTPTTETVFTYVGDKVKTRTETDLTAFNAGSRTWTYAYGTNDTGSQLTSLDGPLPGAGDTTTWTYSVRNDGAGIKGGRLLSVTRPGNLVTSYGGHNALGQPTTVTDPNNVVTQLTYDARGRLLTSTRQDTAQGNPAVTYTRDGVGRITTIQHASGTAANPTTSTTTLVYDDAGDVIGMTDGTGAQVTYLRDDEGNITRIDVHNAGGTLLRRLWQSWDGLQQLTSLTGETKTHLEQAHDGNANLSRDENGLGFGTDRLYDKLDRLITSTDADGEDTQYTWDNADNLASVTDARGLTTSYAYDGLGCLRQQTSPDTGVTTFTCDKAGNVTSQTDARGVTVTLSRDALGRLSSRSYSGAANELAAFTYDDTTAGNLGKGRLTGADNDGADIDFVYDKAGNLVSQTSTVDAAPGQTYTVGYTYDRAGRQTGITFPDGRTVTYLRNAAGQVTEVRTLKDSQEWVVASNISWEHGDNLAGLTYGNGTTETRSYDRDGFLTQLVTGGLTRTYGRDDAGRIISVDHGSGGTAEETYGYDNVDRLTASTGPYGARGYAHDAVGNRETQVRTSTGGTVTTNHYDYALDSNQLEAVTGNNPNVFTYDAAGNTLSKANNVVTYDGNGNQVILVDEIVFTYNAANRLTTARVDKLGAVTDLAFTYNALGQRVSRTVAGTITLFHYDPEGRLLAETGSTGTVIRQYIWLDDKPIGLISKRNGGSSFELFAVHTDHLDTALRLTDSTQAQAWQYTRDPFGQPWAGSHQVRWPLQFPGQYQDNETGMFYNYYRDYDPQTGRYIESDPIGLKGGINTYAYVEGSPVGSTDPDGLQTIPKEPWWRMLVPRPLDTCMKVAKKAKDFCAERKAEDIRETNERFSRRYEEVWERKITSARRCVESENPHECVDRFWKYYDEVLSDTRIHWQQVLDGIEEKYKFCPEI